MSTPYIPPDATCAVCHKRLLPGGTDDQRPYAVEIDRVGDGEEWEPDSGIPVMELRCRACAEVGE